jgi:hypothetical protein
MIITLVFEKNANCFAENWEKSQKIVIITTTPGGNVMITIFVDFYQFAVKNGHLKRTML